jgi:hypothetical protein
MCPSTRLQDTLRMVDVARWAWRMDGARAGCGLCVDRLPCVHICEIWRDAPARATALCGASSTAGRARDLRSPPPRSACHCRRFTAPGSHTTIRSTAHVLYNDVRKRVTVVMYVRYVCYTPVRIGYVLLPFNSASASACECECSAHTTQEPKHVLWRGTELPQILQIELYHGRRVGIPTVFFWPSL